jgi:hypothetical protein
MPWSSDVRAIAEFMRDADEPAEIAQAEETASVVTPRGGIRLVARRTAPDRFRDHHDAGVEPARGVLPARGGERDEPPRRADRTSARYAGAARAERGAVLFDLGLGCLQVDCCIRTGAAGLLEGLRAMWAARCSNPAIPRCG